MRHQPQPPDRIGPILTGRVVLDEHGLRLGTVVDVVFETDGHDPEYLIVKPGPFRRSRYVPTAGAGQTDSGDIVVAWDRDWFRLSPTASTWPAIPPGRRRAVAMHYARP